MKRRNEEGYTLVLVLLIITLIMIFSLTLISNILNSTTQNKTTMKDIQYERLEKMGLLYFHKVIENEIEKLSADDKLPNNLYLTYTIQTDTGAFKMTTNNINFLVKTSAATNSCSTIDNCTNVTYAYNINYDNKSKNGTIDIPLTDNPN